MRAIFRCALAGALALLLPPANVRGQTAPGGPGDDPTWTDGGKEAVGTSTTVDSRIWFTLQGGTLTEVYYPRLDQADVRKLEFIVSDGRSVWLESKDLTHSIEWLEDDALLFRQLTRHPQGLFSIEKTYVTDPRHNTLLIDVVFEAKPGHYALYVLYDPSLKNSGMGDTGYSNEDALITRKSDVASALIASPGFVEMSNGFEGVNDGYTDLLLHRSLSWRFSRADDGNVVQIARLSEGNHFTLALGFGASPDEALASARQSLRQGFDEIRNAYVGGWSEYLRGIRRVNQRYEKQFRLCAMVLKAHEDKTYRGAMIASMSIPWGFAIKSNEANVGGYHLVWARDLYEVASALLLAGDRAAAERALDYLYRVQQKADGSFPQNSWLDGRPYWPSLQMDEVSYPMILAWQLDKTERDAWEHHVRPEAEFLLAHGPATPQERWEEEKGYSPSTIAAEIAGLVCASGIARKNGAAADAERYLRTADQWARDLDSWTVTTTGHVGAGIAPEGYFIRIDNNTNPNDGYQIAIHNGGGTWDERNIVDAGFLELVRLGIRRADDPVIVRSLRVADNVIRVETPSGPAWYRYNHDGYGEKFYGGPYDGTGVGRLWPIFTGERGEYEVALGRDPSPFIETMMHLANAGGMIPEQVWDRAEPSDKKFTLGQGTGSATPLAWSMAQFIRLVVDAEEKRIVEMPDIVAEHFHVSGR